eukprot:GILK01007763.1.p1 GENE.GILK01007763.1~~GILK01007763.1.p1  ORF type:complete len:227 (+),score=13.29 GILK01007763.1:113-793(+)
MRWISLTLDHLASVAKEVDEVIIRFRKLIDATSVSGGEHTQAAEERAQLHLAIQHRIDELERFYYNNDLDERAILFEKQRLKLRKALQLAHLSPPGAPKTRSSAALTRPQTAPRPTARPAPASRSRQVNGTTVDRTRPATSRPTSAPRTRPAAPSAPYSTGRPLSSSRQRPSSSSRVSTTTPATSSSNSTEPQYFEFRIKLTEAEYHELLARKAAMERQQARSGRF